MIHISDLSFSYRSGDKPVLTNLNLHLPSSSWTIVTGPNGSGKSTLLKVIAGLLIPHSGTINLDTQTGEQIGFLGGDPYDWIVGLSVEEDIIFGLENLCLNSAEMERRLQNAIKQTGLAGLEKRLVHTLSGGEQQRLALAAVLAMGSKIILMDEVFTMLDRPARLTVRALMASLCRRHGLTILEASHIPEDIAAADRVVFLQDGRSFFNGEPGDFMKSRIGTDWTRLVPGAANLKSQLLGGGSPFGNEKNGSLASK